MVQLRSLKAFLVSLSLLFPGLVLAWIWIPEFQHYYVPNERIADTVLEQCRRSPSDAVLEEIADYRLLPLTIGDDHELVSSAETLLHGSVEVPGYAPIKIDMPFAVADLERGSGLWQVNFSGLAVPQILLDAYRLTGREDFWIAARESVLAWARYDRSAWVDRGALFDGHALAARIQTLADFWFFYRRRPDYSPEVARTVLEFVNRTGEHLAKPDFFTFATNHGVMENLALWHLCIAFPSLPHVEQYKKLALERLNKQMGFYINREGVVLEHSPAYHEFGLRLLGIALRYATLLNLSVPSTWSAKYEAAKAFYAEIRRPDGTLPRLGDTVAKKTSTQVTPRDSDGHAGPLVGLPVWKPSAAFQVYPVGGYAVFWEGLSNWPKEQELSQTVLSWSYYEGHGHKHADELSLIFWAGGVEWWTNAGYWSYDSLDRRHAECWEGSNAPHLASEPCYSSRVASLVSSFAGKSLSAIEAERKGPGNLVFRRQVLRVAPKVWIVVDDSSGVRQEKLQTIWTTEPDISLARSSSLVDFTLSSPTGEQQLRASFLGPPTMVTRMLRGSREPFAGWLSLNGEPQPSEAILTEQPAEHGWAVTVWTLNNDSNPKISGTPQVLHWGDAHNWRLRLPLGKGSGEVIRRGNTLTLHPMQGARGETAALVRTPDVSLQRAELRDKFQELANQYPTFRELRRYKLRVTYITILALAFQELFFIVYWRNRRVPCPSRPMGTNGGAVFRFLMVLAWIGWGAWLRFFYFRA